MPARTPSAETFLATDEQPAPRLGGASGKGWLPGRSGNPRGRPPAVVDIALMCRKHAPEAVATLVAALRDPKHKVAAATELLNRAFGRPATVITSPDGQSPTGLHLIAAQLVSATIFEAQVEPATQQHEPLLIDLSAPPPTE